jgi:signal transduction histidine kinase
MKSVKHPLMGPLEHPEQVMNTPANLPFDPDAARRTAVLTALQDIARILTLEPDLERLLRKVVHAAAQLLDATSGSLLVWQPEEDVLIFTVTAGDEAEWLEGRRINGNQGLAGWILNHQQPVMVNDVRNDPRFSNNIDKSLGLRTYSLIGVPLMTQGKILGVIEVINKRSGEKFDEIDLEILSALAGQAAIVIVNAQLYQKVLRDKSRLMAIEDQVHKKLARDFHDGPAQALANIVMSIKYAQKLLQQDPQGARDELERTKEIATHTLDQVRNTIFELRPIILETKGLVAALREYVVRLQSARVPPVRLHANDIKHRLPAHIEEACFFIIREAVNNARKYANFSRMDITLTFLGGELVVLVEDDGQGFDVKQVYYNYDEQGSWGLLNMRERAELIGGRLYISSAPGQGTSVTLIVPINFENESCFT